MGSSLRKSVRPPIEEIGGSSNSWPTSATLLCSDATRAPFWLPDEIATTLRPCRKPGVRSGPKLWVSRVDVEAAAVRHHGVAALAERRRGALAQTAGTAARADGGVVVMLHGAGDSGAAIASWCLECGLGAALRERGLSLHAPDAPWRRFTPAGGEVWRAWFDRRGGRDDERDVARSCALAAAEAARACPPGGAVFVVGFSQGGACALHAALRGFLDEFGQDREDGRRLGGVAAMSGWLDRHSASYAALQARGDGKAPLDLLLVHGSLDDVVPAAWVRRNEAAIRERVPQDGSVRVARVEIPELGHEVTPESIGVLVRWLDDRRL